MQKILYKFSLHALELIFVLFLYDLNAAFSIISNFESLENSTFLSLQHKNAFSQIRETFDGITISLNEE